MPCPSGTRRRKQTPRERRADSGMTRTSPRDRQCFVHDQKADSICDDKFSFCEPCNDLVGTIHADWLYSAPAGLPAKPKLFLTVLYPGVRHVLERISGGKMQSENTKDACIERED